jgi:initiation factor 1A
MPNKAGGKGYKKGGRNKRAPRGTDADDLAVDQIYGVVTKKLGGSRMEAWCSDGVFRVARLRGTMRRIRKCDYTQQGDMVVISIHVMLGHAVMTGFNGVEYVKVGDDVVPSDCDPATLKACLVGTIIHKLNDRKIISDITKTMPPMPTSDGCVKFWDDPNIDICFGDEDDEEAEVDPDEDVDVDAI